jgi:hypothetical protein
MATKLASIVVGMMLATQFAYSADVAYQLNTVIMQASEPSKIVEPAKLAIVNREWAVPGVEQSSQDLLPPAKFPYTGPPRLRIEASEDCRDADTCLRYPHVGPQWLDDVAWPLTRELWGSTDFAPNMPASPTVIPPLPPRGFHIMNLASGL